MARVPGNPDKKRELLNAIDFKSLPYLVADILYFTYRHKDTRVVDGPGDGKRDVHSTKPDGDKYIAQCKYHQNFQETVSSNETDELVLALTKFGCKAGLFVTTGRISPQSKREYIDNYPGFELKFMDGLDLVDAVLASPILSAVWFEGKQITQVCKSLYMPFLLRRVRDDRPIVSKEFKPFTIGDLVACKFGWGPSSRIDFEPYRPPCEKTHEEHGTDFLYCYNAQCSGVFSIHEIADYFKLLAEYTAKEMDEADLPAIIRFALPSLMPHVEASEDDRIKIPRIFPSSFIISSNREVQPECDWVVINKQAEWLFPKNLSVAEAPWAGWLNRSENTIFMQGLTWPAFGPDPYFTHQVRKQKENLFRESLFITGTIESCASLSSSLKKKDQPIRLCPYGPGGLMMAWLHPLLEIAESENQALGYLDGKQTVNANWDKLIKEFRERVARMRDKFKHRMLEEVEIKQAQLIAAAAGVEILPTADDKQRIESAELVHYFSEIPSPIYLQHRIFTYVRMWYLQNTPDEILERINATPLILGDTVDIYWEAKLGRKSKKTFLLSSLTYTCPADISADSYFESIKGQRKSDHDKVAEYIRSLCPNAELATEFFWRTEVGFQIDEQGFRGNPYVAFFNEDGTTHIYHITED